MIILLVGAPGAGKGTQADLLVKRCGFRKLSTGDALRKHIRENTPIGKSAAAIMEQGKLVPDDVLLEILNAELGNDPAEVIVLDGYPRNLNQARALAKLQSPHKVCAVAHLDASRAVIVDRLSGRRVCSQCGTSYHVVEKRPSKDQICDNCGGAVVQRPDDRPDSIATRLDVFEESTAPVLDYYRNGGLYDKVEADGDPEAVAKALQKVLVSRVEKCR